MPERNNDGILSLNVKKLLILHLVWKTNRILQYGSLFFIMRLILVRIWRDNLPKYGRSNSPTTPYIFLLFQSWTFWYQPPYNATVSFNRGSLIVPWISGFFQWLEIIPLTGRLLFLILITFNWVLNNAKVSLLFVKKTNLFS